MSVEVEASSLLRAIVSPPRAGESVKALIGRSARAAGLSFNRAKKLWYGEAKAILAVEMDALRLAARTGTGNAERGLRGAFAEANERIARLEARFEALGAGRDRQMDCKPGG